MLRSFDVLVAGVGAMGAATCARLARSGIRVLGVEQFDVPHALGSSGGSTRLIRKAYFEHPDYVPLLERAYELWGELEQQTGRRLFHRSGLLYAGAPDGELISGILRAAAAHHLPIERVVDRPGPLRWPSHFEALFESDAGFLSCDRAIAAFVEDALRHGAEVHGRERILSWRRDGAGLAVETDRDRYRVGRLVLTAGAWAPRMLGGLRVPLVVTRQTVHWVWPRRPSAFEEGAFACWAVQDDAPGFRGLYYGFPLSSAAASAGPLGLKLGHHARGEEVDPDTLDRSPRPEDEAAIRTALAKFLPDADGALLASCVCLYTLTPDGHFVVDRHPEHEAVVMACGFSGHGFKFAPVIGQALAELSTNGRTDLPIGFLSLRRFG